MKVVNDKIVWSREDIERGEELVELYEKVVRENNNVVATIDYDTLCFIKVLTSSLPPSGWDVGTAVARLCKVLEEKAKLSVPKAISKDFGNLV